MRRKTGLNVLFVLVFLVSYGCTANPSTQKTESATPVTIIGLNFTPKKGHIVKQNDYGT